MGNRNNKTRYINSNNDLVSILTPTHNRPDWLQFTLQSLITQTYENWECILVNDAGISVQNVVDNFNDKRIKYFENSINLDLAGTRNVALSKASGDWFIMLDDDDQLYADAIEFRMWRAKKLNAEVVYGRALQNFYEKQGNGYRYVGEKLYWDSPFQHDLILVQNTCPCNCLMWSRDIQEKAGLFDTSLKTSEDWAHSVEMSRYADFYETKIIDCQCSYRTDLSQMTGSRTGYTDHLPYLFKKWRTYATDLDWVITNQNNALRAKGLKPEEYGL
jgi:glycosyltransferase involved in cell wall biosynthesis